MNDAILTVASKYNREPFWLVEVDADTLRALIPHLQEQANGAFEPAKLASVLNVFSLADTPKRYLLGQEEGATVLYVQVGWTEYDFAMDGQARKATSFWLAEKGAATYTDMINMLPGDYYKHGSYIGDSLNRREPHHKYPTYDMADVFESKQFLWRFQWDLK